MIPWRQLDKFYTPGIVHPKFKRHEPGHMLIVTPRHSPICFIDQYYVWIPRLSNQIHSL